MAAAQTVTYDSLLKQISSGNVAPVYLLHGEEGYYIDRLVERFEELLPEDEREFNLHILYAPEVEPDAVMNLCFQYPLMAERQVVILKEAQAVNATKINQLHKYVSNPAATTVLVICSRGEKAKGKDLLAAVKSHGVNFESVALKDYNITPAIVNLLKDKRMSADAKSLRMLSDYIGTDLSRLYNEIGKLAAILGEGATITPDDIERNIGISKDFNNYELLEALAEKNSEKVFRIADYFAANPKDNPVQPTLTVIFGYFADLLATFYCANKTIDGIKNELHKNYPQARSLVEGLRHYNAFQVIEIISAIRRCDAMSKGVGSRQPGHSLLHDLLFHIMTAPGRI